MDGDALAFDRADEEMAPLLQGEHKPCREVSPETITKRPFLPSVLVQK
jgi:hypothetical protein